LHNHPNYIIKKQKKQRNEFLKKVTKVIFAVTVYGVFPGTIDGKRKVRFAEIDIDEKAIKSLDVVMDFDFETGEIGEIKNIKYEDIIGE
jgi:hypothetical protein